MALPVTTPCARCLIAGLPLLQRIPARVLGLGFRPEHIHTPAAPAAA